MPIYNYKCRICNQDEEIEHKINVDKIFECGFCNGIMDKKITIPSKPIFKGSGFYETDYKDK